MGVGRSSLRNGRWLSAILCRSTNTNLRENCFWKSKGFISEFASDCTTCSVIKQTALTMSGFCFHAFYDSYGHAYTPTVLFSKPSYKYTVSKNSAATLLAVHPGLAGRSVFSTSLVGNFNCVHSGTAVADSATRVAVPYAGSFN